MVVKGLRLLTLNIRMGAGGGVLDRPAYDIPASRAREAALIRALQTAGADLVALQEVRGARQAQALAGGLKLDCVYSSHPAGYTLDFFEWGLALMSRYPISRNGNFPVFFDRDVRSGRNGIWATIDVAGQPVGVMNVHFEIRDPEAQIEALVARIDRTRPPLIVMGDFNLTPDDLAIAPLHRTLVDTCRAADTPGSREVETVGTLVGAGRRIDSIFVSGDDVFVNDAGLLPPPHRGISDHLGYYADVELPPRPGNRRDGSGGLKPR